MRTRLEIEEAASPAEPVPSGHVVGPTWTWPKPWDFGGYIHDKRQGFIGRTWLFDEVEAWLNSTTQALLIVADYGVGKSSFLAKLVRRNPNKAIAAHHFCHHDTDETLNPATFVRSIASQLAHRLPDYKSAVEKEPELREWLDKADKDPGSAIERAIVAPLNHIATPSADALYIVVDALDESLEFDSGKGGLSRQHIAGLLAIHASRLPGWLKILATSRRRQEILQLFRQSFRAQTLDAEDARNLQDIHDYVLARCRTEPIAGTLAQTHRDPEQIAGFLANPNRSKGKMLYVVRVLNDVASGSLAVQRLADLPPGMDGFYLDAFERRFGTGDYEAVRPVLAVLAAAREPLGRTDLMAILEKPESQVQTTLATLEDFLSIRAKRYAFDHYSLAQWLTEENDQGFPRAGRFAISLVDGQQWFRAWVLKQVSEDVAHESSYLARHLPMHLAPKDRANTLRKLLLDFRWLSARLREAGINPLLNDYSEAPEDPEISAVGQALEQAAHIVGHEEVDWSGLDQLASQLSARLLHREEPRICRLLSDARSEQQRQRKLWLNPLTASLQASSFLIRTLEGHSRSVNALALLPDGRLASGAALDKTIKLWDLASGHCTATLEGPSRSVDALALLPDGRLASGSEDKTIRIWSWWSKQQKWTSSVAFVADASIYTLSYAPAQRILVAGDAAGRVHFLEWDDSSKS